MINLRDPRCPMHRLGFEFSISPAQELPWSVHTLAGGPTVVMTGLQHWQPPAAIWCLPVPRCCQLPARRQLHIFAAVRNCSVTASRRSRFAGCRDKLEIACASRRPTRSSFYRLEITAGPHRWSPNSYSVHGKFDQWCGSPASRAWFPLRWQHSGNRTEHAHSRRGVAPRPHAGPSRRQHNWRLSRTQRVTTGSSIALVSAMDRGRASPARSTWTI